MMSAQDYDLIADSLKRTLGRVVAQDIGGAKAGIEQTIRDLSWALTDTNPRFDRVRFLRACGLTVRAKDI